MNNKYTLPVPAPHHFSFAVRDIPDVTVEQRERVLKALHYNEFAFPAGMLTVDMLSDSGTTAMTNHQWAALFMGDEAYGRNTGYYVLLDFAGQTDIVNEMERNFKIDDKVLKYITEKTDEIVDLKALEGELKTAGESKKEGSDVPAADSGNEVAGSDSAPAGAPASSGE